MLYFTPTTLGIDGDISFIFIVILFHALAILRNSRIYRTDNSFKKLLKP